ncbi:RhoA protein [Athelia psychrophila]|uniref:RhoA protein n=1 Tax=Athelia psychrophila TaxID=1759441 RepID=A0A166SSK3_9AGAM|nr:RhoA protein [Fibularhizoctonia sp. CBS 109695]
MPNTLMKAVTVGDKVVGKTSLIIVCSRDWFPEEMVYIPRQTPTKEIEVDGLTIEMALWDTQGDGHYDRLRPLSYPQSDVILICFAIDCPTSFSNVTEKWTEEVGQFCPRTPFLLVGCKQDLRDDTATISDLKNMDETFITSAMGKALANQIGAVDYFECSAKRKEGVNEVFHEACKAALHNSSQRECRKGRCILQ